MRGYTMGNGGKDDQGRSRGEVLSGSGGVRRLCDLVVGKFTIILVPSFIGCFLFFFLPFFNISLFRSERPTRSFGRDFT